MKVTKFRCPECGSATRVIDSRCKGPSATRRRRLCLNPKCEYRVTTVERIFAKEEFDLTPEKKIGTPPLYLFTIMGKNFMRAIEAGTRKRAENIAIEKGWTKKADWELTFLGFPARKE
jgi:hypothetical protein